MIPPGALSHGEVSHSRFFPIAITKNAFFLLGNPWDLGTLDRLSPHVPGSAKEKLLG